MKLVEILAMELEKWPEGVMTYSQDDNGTIGACDSQPSRTSDGVGWSMGSGNWVQDAPHNGFKLKIASDASTAIVTRADWEAERAKLKAPKANGDGWIRHRGGKCPVEAGVLVDVRYRRAEEYHKVTGLKAGDYSWFHEQEPGDIMAYRIHKPAEQTSSVKREAVAEAVKLAQFKPDSSATADTMLAIRDRIRELDAQRAEVESTYQRQINEITQERESLVQKLAGEGLALVEVEVQPVEDMSDWRNWRVGDLLMMENADDWDLMLDGKLYEMVKPEDGHNFAIMNDRGDLKSFHLDYKNSVTIDFKWHSRPTS